MAVEFENLFKSVFGHC